MAEETDLLKELQDKITFAKRLHGTAIENMDGWEDLFKGDYDTPKNIADNSKQIRTFNSARPRAIVDEMTAKLNLRAKQQIQVPPKKDSIAEDSVCSKLELYLRGYQDRMYSEVKTSFTRKFVQNALIFGKGVLLAKYIPKFVNSEYFPIRSYAPNPRTVYEVEGDGGVLYFVHEQKRYLMELKKELSANTAYDEKKKAKNGSGWRIPEAVFSRYSAPTDEITVMEYWDAEYYACLVEDEVVLEPTPHEYGFCPISIARINDTPFDEAEWKGQSVFASIEDALKDDAILMSKMGDAVSSFFWPLVFWVTEDGRGGWVNPYAASASTIPPNAKLQIYNPSPNIPIIQAYKQWLDGQINLATLPEIAFGMDASAQGNSGFAISQVLSTVMDRIQDKKTNIEVALADHFGQVLQLTEKFSDRANEGKFEVLVAEDDPKSSKRKLKTLQVGKQEVAEHHKVVVNITPSLPTEKMATIQQLALLRQPSPLNGLPMADDDSLREMSPDIFEQPDKIKVRLGKIKYAKELPQIAQWDQEEFLQEWEKDHPPHYDPNAKGEGGMADLMKLGKGELAKRLLLLQQMISNPQAFQQALQQMGGPAQGGQPGQPPGAPMPGMAIQGAPGGPQLPGQMMPGAMQTGQPNPNPNSLDLAAQQMQGALMPPGM